MNEMEDSERPVKRQRLSVSLDREDGIQTEPKHDSGREQPPTTNLHTTGTRESEVGISEYVSREVTPFRAVFKKRYTDFLVNEILPSGEVVHLTDTAVPQRLSSDPYLIPKGKKAFDGNDLTSHSPPLSGEAGPNTAAQVEEMHDLLVQPQIRTPGDVADGDRQQLIDYLNKNAVDELLQLYKAIINHPTRNPKDHQSVRTAFTDDRSVRADIHAAIRRIFASKIESSTDREGFLCLTPARSGSRKANKQRGGGSSHPRRSDKLDWLERGGDYIHFSLHKENKDTMEVISFLTKQMKTSPKTFQFAGTKDRRAVTCQRVSAYRLDPERLAKQNSLLRGAVVGNFECKPYGLELGDLGGNEFVLTLRECDFPGMENLGLSDKLLRIQSVVRLALANLSTQGFVNYYGLQRFGTFSTGTDTIGFHILKSDFRSACEGILQYNQDLLALADSEDESKPTTWDSVAPHVGPSRDEILRAKAIHLFEKTGNAHKPLDILPRRFNAENQMMRHLARFPSDYIGALLAIPRNLRLMYVHAYQSLVWNQAASHRWRMFGGRVVEGDLVLVKEHEDKENIGLDHNGPCMSATTSTALDTDVNSNIDADGEIVVNPSDHDRSHQIDDIFERARTLTAAEALSGQYIISDIVLPLPGFDVLYPANASGEFYKKFMSSDAGGGLDPYNMRRKHKDFSLSGGYRKLLAFIGKEFDISVHSYRNDKEQFVVTDWEKLKVRMGTIAADKSNGHTSLSEQKNPGSDSHQYKPGNANNTDAFAATNMDNDAGAAATISDTQVAEAGSTEGEIEMKDAGKEEEKKTEAEAEVKAEADADTDKVAVVLKFQLGASQYATMALRELSRGGIVSHQTDAK